MMEQSGDCIIYGFSKDGKPIEIHGKATFKPWTPPASFVVEICDTDSPSDWDCVIAPSDLFPVTGEFIAVVSKFIGNVTRFSTN